MINYGLVAQLSKPVVPVSSCRIVGLGGAGVAFLERLDRESGGIMDLVAIHTSAQALHRSCAVVKVQIGREATKGLGAGGDAGLGRAAGQESADEIRAACEGAELVILCAGLGGGTASGAAPLVAQQAKAAGAMVIGLVTLPFAGEGGKRKEQAEEALVRLGRHCVTVLCFENDRMSELGSTDATVREAFTAAEATLSRAVRSVLRMVGLPAIMPVGLDELWQMFRGAEARCQFGYGSGTGPDRVIEAVEQALQDPLLDDGTILSEPGDVLVHLTAGENLRLAEVQSVLLHLSRHFAPSSQVLLGVSEDPANAGALEVVIMAATKSGVMPAVDEEEESSVDRTETTATIDHDGSEPEKQPAKPAAKRGAKSAAKREGGATQVELPFEQTMRGRFKDLDPTMVEGQDLDVPTYIRMRLRLK
jgi:cell division protein FtsZ